MLLQKRDITEIYLIRVSVTQPSTPASMEHRVAIWSFFDALIPEYSKIPKLYLETQMEHDQSSYFCRGPDDFCSGPAPVGPTLVTGPEKRMTFSHHCSLEFTTQKLQMTRCHV